MFTTDPRAALTLAAQRARELREEMAVSRSRQLQFNCPLAALLRRFARRPPAAPLSHGTV